MSTARREDDNPTELAPLPQPPRLRVFAGDDPPGDETAAPPGANGLTPQSTLTEFYFDYFEPAVLRNARRPRDPKTIDQYRYAVARWADCTSDPPMGSIDEETLDTFCRRCAARPGLKSSKLSPWTLDKTIRELQTVLDWAGPRERRRRQWIGYGKRGLYGTDEDGDPRPAPMFGPGDRPTVKPDPMPVEAIEAWLSACDGAAKPKCLGQGDRRNLFAAFLAWHYYVGTRLDTTYHLRWSMLKGPWLLIPRSIFKGHRRDVLVYVSRPALEVAAAVRLGHDDRIFPWPCRRRYLQDQLKELRDASQMDPAEQHGGVHRLRARLLTTLAQHNPLVAKYQAGHSVAGDVLLEHYVSAEQASTWPAAVEAVPRLALPDWFGRGGQLRLF